MKRKYINIGVLIVVSALTGPWLYSSPNPRIDIAAEMKKVPPFHKSAGNAELPDVLPASQFTGNAKRAYEAAAKAKDVLYQQPCYCYCNIDKGHTSLLDCFRTEHGSTCTICQREAIYAYEQTLAGKSPKQIRKEIIAGAWKQVHFSTDAQ